MKTVTVFRLYYIKELLNNNWDVYCIAPNDDEKAIHTLTELGVKVYPASNATMLTMFLTMNFLLYVLLFKKRFDLLISSHFLVTFIVCLPALAVSRKNVCFIEGIGSFFSNKKWLLSILRFLLNKISHRCIFMNKYEQRLLGDTSDFVLNGIGVDLDKFQPTNSRKNKYPFSKKLLYVGRLIKDKGILDVIEVARLLAVKKVDFHLDIIGDIYPSNPSSLTYEDIKQLEAQFGRSISFHGYREQIEEFYHYNDVLLLLSSHEGFPVVVMEANACGLPAICYDVPGCTDAISDNVNGKLFKRNQTDLISNYISTTDFLCFQDACREYSVRNFNQKRKIQFIFNKVFKSLS